MSKIENRKSKIRIAVIGPGGIGCLFAGLLAEGGHEVHLVDRRPERAALIMQDGLIIERNGELRKIALQAHAHPADIGSPRQIDLVILCVKSHETAGTIPSIQALSGPTTKVLSLQNGLGNLEVIERIVEGDRLFAGTTTMGATVLGLNHILHAGIGATVIGPLGNNFVGAEFLANTLSGAGIEAKPTRDTPGMLWSKLVINAAILPVSVLANLPNGELVKNDKWRVLLEKAAQEAGAVAAAKKIKLLFDDPAQAVLEVCLKTAANISSMLQDVRRGRKTEIEAINGVIIRAASGAGIEAPTNAMLYEKVVELEEHRD